MKHLLLSVFAVLIQQMAFAAPGDTTIVQTHPSVHMNYYGTFDDWGIFPDGSKTYRKILLKYTLGCPSGGCSDWDYTTKIELLKRNNPSDSTFQNIELVRLMTPYGGNYGATWKNEHWYEITDFVGLLRDSVQIRAFYDGYSDGYTVKLDFYFIEGTPVREVLDLQSIYHGGFSYGNPSNPIEANLPAQTLTMPAGTQGARMRVTPSGHGADNNGCSEFCSKYYQVLTGGTMRYQQDIWRTCGDNPLYPQPGTWVYDRANWCPGSRTITYEHELSAFLPTTGNTIDVDLNLQPYTSPNGGAFYYIDGQMVFYGAPTATNDVEILDILAPNSRYDLNRRNPVCREPKITIRNLGSAPLTTLTITYQAAGGTAQTYNWQGNLAFMQSTDVTLPNTLGMGLWGTGTAFTVTLSQPNGQTDQYPLDNAMTSAFALPYTLPSRLIVDFRTNNLAYENRLVLTDAAGNVILERDNLDNTTTYRDTLTLTNGCYNFHLTDTGGDGLSFWANSSQGSGYFRVRNAATNGIVKTYQADFGNDVYEDFYVDSYNGAGSIQVSPTRFDMFPNPAQNYCDVEMELPQSSTAMILVRDVLGKTLYMKEFPSAIMHQTKLDLSNYSNGVYFITWQYEGGEKTERLVISK